jgi:hypothetical protein
MSVLVAAVLLVSIAGIEIARRKASASLRIAAATLFVGFVLTLIALAPQAG